MKFLRFLLIVITAGIFFSSCQKEFEFEGTTAAGTLKEDMSGDCLPVLINGTYQKDTLLTSSNYVDVQVEVSQTGTYFIKTDTVNGYSFSASGTVGVTGLNTVRLVGAGRPIAPGLDVFHVMFDTSICEINILVTGTGGPANTDSIVADINSIHKVFKIGDTAKYDYNASVPGYDMITIFGGNNATPDEAFALGVGVPTGTSPIAAPATFDASQYPAFYVAGGYINSITGDTYALLPGFTPIPSPPFTITITSLTPTKVEGTFSGAIPDLSGGPDLDVQNGKFSVTIYP